MKLADGWLLLQKTPGWHRDYGRASGDHYGRLVEHSTDAYESPANEHALFRQGGLCKLTPWFAEAFLATFR